MQAITAREAGKICTGAVPAALPHANRRCPHRPFWLWYPPSRRTHAHCTTLNHCLPCLRTALPFAPIWHCGAAGGRSTPPYESCSAFPPRGALAHAGSRYAFAVEHPQLAPVACAEGFPHAARCAAGNRHVGRHARANAESWPAARQRLSAARQGICARRCGSTHQSNSQSPA